MTNNCRNKKYPKCFGELETVFPQTKDGLRSTPETCLECFHKTACLRSAMGGADGVKVREEIVDRAYDSGMMSFLERWSKKKDLKRKLKKSSKECITGGNDENHKRNRYCGEKSPH